MYARFYDPGKKPFGLSPSSLSLYLGETHREALAFLTYCVVEKEGLALVTGEAGTGKTTIARALIQNMEDDAELVYLSNPALTAAEFYDYLGSSLFKRRIHYPSKAVFLLEFEKFFRRRRKERKNIVLIIDDAQALSFDLIEEIRLLSNMESMEAGKYINIILLGQPDLTEKLNEVRCRPLLQRIGLRHHIRPLKLANSREYIATRLKIAGAADKATEVFTKRALEAIGEYSRGLPRMINILAQNSMFLCRSKGKKRVTATMVEECRRQLAFHERSRQEGGNQTVYRYAKPTESEKTAGRLKSGWSRWAAPALLLLIAALWGSNFQQWQLPWQALKQSALFEQTPAEEQAQAKALIRMKITPPQTMPSKKEPRKPQSGGIQEKKFLKAGDPDQPVQAAAGSSGREPKPSSKAEFMNWLSVAGGGNLLKLATENYGAVSEPIIELIAEYNSGLTDSAGIPKTGRIGMPALPAELKQPVFIVHVASYKHFKYAQELFERWWKKGRDIHIVLQRDTPEGLVYRVAFGRFRDPAEAKAYAASLLEEGVFSYAQPIRLDLGKKTAALRSAVRN